MTTTHRATIAVVLALVLGASAAPASAWVSNLNANGSYVPALTSSQAAKPVLPVSPPPTIVRITAPSSGFDWGDAAIGAACGLALAMIGLGGTLAVSQHRTRRTRNSTATIS